MPRTRGSSSSRPRSPHVTESSVPSQGAQTVNVTDADEPGPDRRSGVPDALLSGSDSDSLDKPEPSGPRTISVRLLNEGTVLDEDIFDRKDVLLLRAGHKITANFLRQLSRRGTAEVVRGSLSGPEPTAETGPAKSPESAESPEPGDGEQTEAAGAAPPIEPSVAISHSDAGTPDGSAGIAARLDLLKLKTELQESQRGYQVLIDCCSTLVADLIRRQPVQLDPIAALLSGYVDMFGRDRSLGVLRMQNDSSPQSYLFQHGVNVAILTMNVALHMGFREDQVIDAGLGAMLHDTGMLKVPWALWQSSRKLTQEELFEIKRHPTYVADVLERVSSVPPTTLLVAYQMHERHDGSGYPNRRRSSFIHPLARIAAVADSYLAGCSRRSHRGAKSPYNSMVDVILDETKRGRFDPTVSRAFLDHLSLFPIGSDVTLSNDQQTTVLRANPGKHTQPVVVPYTDAGEISGTEVNLATDDSIHVVSALGWSDWGEA